LSLEWNSRKDWQEEKQEKGEHHQNEFLATAYALQFSNQDLK